MGPIQGDTDSALMQGAPALFCPQKAWMGTHNAAISIWIYQCQAAAGHAALQTIFYRLARLLTLPVHPLLVFDGPCRPAVKRGRRLMHRRLPMESAIKRFAEAFGFTWLQVSLQIFLPIHT